MQKLTVVFFVVAFSFIPAPSIAGWLLDQTARAGPIVARFIHKSANLNMVVMFPFEYERQCEPIVSYLEFYSPPETELGVAISRYRITNQKVGIIINDRFYTWHAARINYKQGFEVGFGITAELWQALLGPIESLVYVRIDGQHFNLPVDGLRKQLLNALKACRAR